MAYNSQQKYESIFLVLSSGGCSSFQGFARCLRLDAWALSDVCNSYIYFLTFSVY